MGKTITTRKQYDEEMKRGGYTTQEKARDLANKARKKSSKTYTPSAKARAIINSCNKDRKGRVRLSDRQIDGLKSMGVTFDEKKKQEVIKETNLQGR